MLACGALGAGVTLLALLALWACRALLACGALGAGFTLLAFFALLTLRACRALRATRTRDALSNGNGDFDFVGGVIGVGHDDGGGLVAGGGGIDRGLECVGGACREVCGVGDVVLGVGVFANLHRRGVVLCDGLVGFCELRCDNLDGDFDFVGGVVGVGHHDRRSLLTGGSGVRIFLE